MLVEHPCAKAIMKAAGIADGHRANGVSMIAVANRNDLTLRFPAGHLPVLEG